MDELNKDTLQSEASQEKPSNMETQVESPQVSDTTSAPEEGSAEKVYAGKFKSVDELEKSYKGLETKIGKKSYSEQIGEQVLSATGYTVEQLESAGYTPAQIAQAVTSNDQAQQSMQQVSSYSPTEVIKKSVEDSRVERLEFELKLRDFFNENPEAKDFKDEIKEYHSMPNYRGMNPEEIYEAKLKKFVNKGAQVTLKKQSEKERASLNLTNNSVPESRNEDAALKNFMSTRHIDDAGVFIKERLFGRK